MKPEPFGNYTLLRLLGKGGMAEVFLARARSIGGFEKLVAIKRLLPPFNIDNQILSMLADEARLSVWLTHPNIVQVLDFGKVGKTYYIAMEYVEGCDLCDLIRPDGQSPGRPLPLPTALYVMVQVAEALDFAHRRRNDKGETLGVIHRDVSPHNVLISTEGQVKLADFGLARASISVHHSHEGVIRGKFSYMPKEQAHGREIDQRIDLFAAGVTLYESLTGTKPYTSTTLPQQLYQLEQPVPPPSALIPDIPEEIDDLTLEAMSPDPEERYRTAEDLANDLRAALLKVSTFAQEERQLTALVKNSLASRGIHPIHDALPHMSLADLPVTDDNLIGEELRMVRLTQHPVDEGFAPTRSAPGELHNLDDLAGLDDDEEGDTSQFHQHQRVNLPLPSADEEDFDSKRTVAIYGSEDAAPSLPPAALDPSTDGETEAMDRPPGVIAGELDSSRPARPRASSVRGSVIAEDEPGSFPSPEDLGLYDPPAPVSEPSGPRDYISDSVDGLDSEPAVDPNTFDPPGEPAPYDTLRDGEKAGHLAREAMEYARTIQRSPDQALAAFQRALDEREQLRKAAERAHLHPLHWVGLAGVGVALLCGGVAAGWFLHKPEPPPTPANVECPKCPKPAPCPKCPPPKAAAPVPKDAGPDARKPETVTLQREAKPGRANHRRAGASPGPKRTPSQRQPQRQPQRHPRRRPHRTPPPRRAPPARPPRPAAGKGLLVVTADSPARAFVDSRTFGALVPARLPLAAGIHTVRVRFLETDTMSKTRFVTIRADETTRINFILED
jgi:serine/threonine protein kinase